MTGGPAIRARSLGRAVRFLTLLPVPAADHDTGHDLAGALHWFPVVGLLIGLLSAGAGLAAHYLFGSPVHAVAAVAASALVTAGFHLDGLADTCDGLLSWRGRVRKLEIMQDSRVGAMGVMAMILVIALKIAALLALGDEWWIGALLCPVFGRWADLYGITSFPAAKSEGLASHVRAAPVGGVLLRAAAPTALAAAPLFYLGEWYMVIAWLAGAFLVVHGFAAAAARALGGLTGDVYGAMSEIGEVAALLAMCALLG